MPEAPSSVKSGSAACHPVLGLLVVFLGAIAGPLDSAVNIAFPSITRYFAREVHDILWVVVAYVLTYSSLLLIFGKLGDLIGYRIVFQIGLATSAGGFAGCAFATSFEVLLLGRALQGIGNALVLSCAPALATSLYGEQERTRILGIYAAMTALGVALGPLVGGILVERLGWSVVFWARMPLVVMALALSWVIPARPGHGSPSGLDPLGSLQLVIALCGILLGLSVRIESIGPVLPLGAVGLGSLVLVAFLRRQARRENPIIRPALFRDPAFLLMNAASVIANFAAFSVVLIGPFYLLRVARLETSLAGLVLALGAFGMIIGSSIAASVIAKLGGFRTAIVGMAVSAAGLLGIATWTTDVPIYLLAPPLIVQGFGMGLFQVAYADLVTATLPVADRGVAGSLIMVTRTIGIVGGAAGLASLHRYFESAAASDGAEGIVPFMAGFHAVFVGAATAQVMALGIGALLARQLLKRAAKAG